MTLVVLGDSIAFGQWVNRSWVSLLELDELVVNLSIPGDTTRLALERYPEVRRYKPDTLLIALGLNDCNIWDTDGVPRVGPMAFEGNLDDLVQRGQHDGARVILQTNHPTSKDRVYDERVMAYNTIIRHVAKHHGVVLSDLARDVPLSEIKDELILTLDGIHPTPEGHERIAARVRAIL